GRGGPGLRGGVRSGVAHERVAESLHCPDDPWLPRVVAERAAQLRDLVRDARVRDERPGPETLGDLVFRDGVGLPGDQQLEQSERLGRQIQDTAAAEDLPGPRIEHAVAEGEAHRATPDRNREESLETADDSANPRLLFYRRSATGRPQAPTCGGG